MLALSVLGFPMSWSKGMVGKQIQWIGAQLQDVGSINRATCAEFYCSNIGAQLPCITSEQENEELWAVTKPGASSYGAWIGLSENTDNEWEWQDGCNSSYANKIEV